MGQQDTESSSLCPTNSFLDLKKKTTAPLLRAQKLLPNSPPTEKMDSGQTPSELLLCLAETFHTHEGEKVGDARWGANEKAILFPEEPYRKGKGS